MTRIIVTWAGEVWFTEWQWLYWKKAFSVVISDPGISMKGGTHEGRNKGNRSNCNSMRTCRRNTAPVTISVDGT